MNGVHDMGGMNGFGAIPREENEPVFHADWERRVFALALATMGSRLCNTDEFRRTIERMPPARYLASSYYERWLYAIESLLLEKGVVTEGDLDAALGGIESARDGSRSPDAPVMSAAESPRHNAAALRRDRSFKARFKPGDRVIARNMNPAGHTRIPRYVRGRRGVIKYDWGVFVFPDTHAHGQGANPQHCYAVEFSARELWGEAHSDREPVRVDLWENYLERDRVRAVIKTKPGGAGTRARKSAARPRNAPTARKSAAPKPRRPR